VARHHRAGKSHQRAVGPAVHGHDVPGAAQGRAGAEDDPQVKRLRAIAQRIIPNTPRWNQSAQQWKWQVNLVKSDQVNAFCMPGGRIGFYTGIIDKLKLTDDEIAAVMGHEIAHALREHGRDRQSKATTTGLASSVLGAAISAWSGYDVRGRDQQRRPAAGAEILARRGTRGRPGRPGHRRRAGYDPRAGVALWNKMAQLNKSGAPIALLSTHPGGERPASSRSNRT
jgi:predicted Zn-dependent protease